METVTPTGRNLINTQDSYKKCEEKIDANWSGNNSSIDSWVLRDIHNYSVAILLPVFLALCFLISMLGAVFLFTSLFLITKVYVMEVFVNECNSCLIILIFITNGIHLLSTGLSGVLGLGKRRWLLVMHSMLAVVALVTMLISYYFEPRYEVVVMDEVDTNMWISLSRTRFKYHAGWDYIQRNMQCCGVNSYTDWCGCRNTTVEIKKTILQPQSRDYEAPQARKKCNKNETNRKSSLHYITTNIPDFPNVDHFSKENNSYLLNIEKLQTKEGLPIIHHENIIPVNQQKMSTEEKFPSKNTKREVTTMANSFSSEPKELHSQDQQNLEEYPEQFFVNSYEEYDPSSLAPIKPKVNVNEKNKIVLLPEKEKPSPEKSFFVVKHVDDQNKNLSGLIPLPTDKYGFPSRDDRDKILADIRKERIVIECYIPESCCIMNNNFPYDEPDRKCKEEKDETGINNRGCRVPVKQIMRRFINSFTSICKFVIMVMVLDLPLVILMIYTN